jgi:prepilin-type N-terminal cleavage/methylation domain-containing protein
MSHRKGFTLIELLIVVVIIGILVAIAIPKFASTKEKAYLASMKSDLRNLTTAQEGYFADNTAYLSGTATNRPPAAPAPDVALGNYTPSSGVAVTYGATGGTGWSAVATHSATNRSCAMFVGAVPPLAPAVVEGEPKCQ